MSRLIVVIIYTNSLLFAAASSHAALIFSVDSFTTDELVITLYGGQTLDGPTPSGASTGLYLADRSGDNPSWIISTCFGSASNAQMIGSESVISSRATNNNAGGDFLLFSLSSTPNPGDLTNVSATYTFSQVGAFNPAGVDIANLGLQWGAGARPIKGGTFQSFAIVPSVVPEPSTYIAAVGFLGLGMFVIRRRRRNVTETVSAEQ